MKKYLLILCCAIKLNAFDFTLTWDKSQITTDNFDTNITTFANVTGIKVYRGDTVTNFVLIGSYPYVTNLLTLTNQPLTMGFYYITFTNMFFESLPSNTNQIFPPMPPPVVERLKVRK